MFFVFLNMFETIVRALMHLVCKKIEKTSAQENFLEMPGFQIKRFTEGIFQQTSFVVFFLDFKILKCQSFRLKGL